MATNRAVNTNSKRRSSRRKVSDERYGEIECRTPAPGKRPTRIEQGKFDAVRRAHSRRLDRAARVVGREGFVDEGLARFGDAVPPLIDAVPARVENETPHHTMPMWPQYRGAQDGSPTDAVDWSQVASIPSPARRSSLPTT